MVGGRNVRIPAIWDGRLFSDYNTNHVCARGFLRTLFSAQTEGGNVCLERPERQQGRAPPPSVGRAWIISHSRCFWYRKYTTHQAGDDVGVGSGWVMISKKSNRGEASSDSRFYVWKSPRINLPELLVFDGSRLSVDSQKSQKRAARPLLSVTLPAINEQSCRNNHRESKQLLPLYVRSAGPPHAAINHTTFYRDIRIVSPIHPTHSLVDREAEV